MSRGSQGDSSNSPERVVQIRRCACVVKGGRRFSFTALVVVGDSNGKVGVGYSKGTEVPVAVENLDHATMLLFSGSMRPCHPCPSGKPSTLPPAAVPPPRR